ncbi:MAG: hypothetical protein FWE28_01395 [Oscillospiraceae bacterium]|nr:hypothetical protein [Oscillospiraceae bacterium]
MPIFEHISIEHQAGGVTALDHWSFEYYYIWREGFCISTEYKVQNRRHSALDLGGYIGAQPLCFLCFFAKRQRRPARQGIHVGGSRQDRIGGTPNEKVKDRAIDNRPYKEQ